MKKVSAFLSLTFLFLLIVSNIQAQNLCDYVNPNIGSVHSRWFFYTPASMPFGMAKAGPTTNAHYGNKGGWEAVGYDGRHDSIEGFANVHEFQVGGIVLMPTTGELQTIPGELDNPESGYRSRFSKSTEKASAGSYSVSLSDYNINVELTATKRVAFHRYSFPSDKTGNIIFDIGNVQGESGQILDAGVEVVADNCVEGYVISYPVYVNKYQNGATVPIYFVARLNEPQANWGVFKGKDIFPGQKKITGPGSGAYCSFAPETNHTDRKAIEIKVGISYTSLANARANLAAEADSLNFDQALSQCRNTWEAELAKIQVQGGRHEDKVKFYTGLYHALLGRGCAMDINGDYPRNDGSIGRIAPDETGKPSFVFCNTDAIWGGFWNLTQLWPLAWPEYFSDQLQTHLQVFQDAGWLGDGLANSRYVSGVGTNFVGLMLASAWQKGIRNYDVELAYAATRKNELTYTDRPAGAGKLDMQGFVENGFIAYSQAEDSANGSQFCASRTMEYCFSAYAAALWAKELGKMEDYEQLLRLSGQWKTIFNRELGLIHPKDADGNFLPDFDPYQPWRGFQEGNSMQYTYYVPHAVSELVELIGPETFNQRLNEIFEIAQKNGFSGGKEVDAFSGLRFVYNHGNQPSLHIAWLFNRSGRPDLAQKWTRSICNEFYGTEELHGYGFGQDEDQGQLGAWYVMAAMGLFQIDGGITSDSFYELGSPVFDSVTISLANGNKFNIITENNSPDNYYMINRKFNGLPCSNDQISHKILMQGGTLIQQATNKIPATIDQAE
ncbi:MAG: GH92 family glycosyl hydrolase [Sedimentisphaerales bacterium]|nr:GH92 family glycosyl hydrolase [Sedimentisphaerales bacterium]MBN2842375.1 GH92 family glycosyl hydrolase [Sedimentisphaerales bacterium]